MSLKISCLLLLLFILNICISVRTEIDLTIFNDTKIDQFERQLNNLQPNEYRRFLSRLGKIAFFTRLIRKFAQSPNVGRVDFKHFFPKPELPFHHKVYENCNEDITKCVNFIYEKLQSRAPFLFPVKGQRMNDFPITEDNFNRLLTNNLFQFDVTVSYLFCFLSKNKFEGLRKLPFCKYDVFTEKNNKWPADRYKELKQREELIIEPGKDYEIIDELTSWKNFSCSEQSFCPNPCCGFSLDTECAHPICQNAGPNRLCSMKNDLNLNLVGMVANSWNVSCKCDDPGYVFRFDVEKCVDSDECEKEPCSDDKHEECVNMLGTFKCVCQMGYVRNRTTHECYPIEIFPYAYSDPATT